MRYNIEKILSFASSFEKKAQSKPVSLWDYEQRGLLNSALYDGKRAKPGFSLTGNPYPQGYVGGYSPDGSGLPKGFDDDLPIDDGMNSNQIQSWVSIYLGETDPSKLSLAASMFKEFPLAASALTEKATYIKANTKS